MFSIVTVPQLLIDEVMRGNSALFLGAGCSAGAKCAQGALPGTQELADRLATKFLNRQYVGKPLAVVADLCLATCTFFELETFLRDQFKDAEPTTAHLLVPSFSWAGLITTNFDML